jgi:hypothetical protein
MRVTTAHSRDKDEALWKATQQPILEIAQILKLEAAICTEMKWAGIRSIQKRVVTCQLSLGLEMMIQRYIHLQLALRVLFA